MCLLSKQNRHTKIVNTKYPLLSIRRDLVTYLLLEEQGDKTKHLFSPVSCLYVQVPLDYWPVAFKHDIEKLPPKRAFFQHPLNI